MDGLWRAVAGDHCHCLFSPVSRVRVEKSNDGKATKRKTSSRLGCLSVLILALFAFALLSFTAYLQAFHAFTKQQLVAIVECKPALSDSADFSLTLIPVVKDMPQQAQVYEMVGNQWAIGGDILKWHSAMNMLGLHTHYRLTRLEGRQETVARTRQKAASAYSLVEQEQSEVWKTLYEVGAKLPLVSSAYGNTVYTYPHFSDRFKVYVTTSGFMVERVKGDKGKAGRWLEEILDYARPQPRDPSPR